MIRLAMTCDCPLALKTEVSEKFIEIFLNEEKVSLKQGLLMFAKI